MSTVKALIFICLTAEALIWAFPPDEREVITYTSPAQEVVDTYLRGK